jgi:hypothetical protein
MKPIHLFETHDLDTLIEVIHAEVVGVCDDAECGVRYARCSGIHYDDDDMTSGCGSALIRFGFDDESQPMPELQQIDHADYTIIVKRVTLFDHMVDDMYNIEMLIEWEGDR